GCHAGRASGPAADDIRVGHQPQDREGPGTNGATDPGCARRRDHRMKIVGPEAARVAPRGRLLPKYASILAGLVAGALIISGAVQIFFSDADHRDALARIQAEKAAAAAEAIAQFVNEIELQIHWLDLCAKLPSATPLFQQFFRQTPAVTELSYLDETGRQQI